MIYSYDWEGKVLPVSSTNVEIMTRQSSSEIRLQIPGRSSSRRRMYFKTKSMLSVWREDPVWAAWDKSVLELIEPPPLGSGKPWSDFNKLSKLSDMLEEQNTKFSTFSDLLMSSFYSCFVFVDNLSHLSFCLWKALSERFFQNIT